MSDYEMDKLVTSPNGLSCLGLKLALAELKCKIPIVELDPLSFEHLKMESPTMMYGIAKLPILGRKKGDAVFEDDALQLIHIANKQVGAVCLLPGGDEGAQLNLALEQLCQVDMEKLTLGLAFHTELTSLLRWPFNIEEWQSRVRAYVTELGPKLTELIEILKDENPILSAHMKELMEEHQEVLDICTDIKIYQERLSSLQELLDLFEEALGSDGRAGMWLGGHVLSMVDITLGLYLHRIWQLGLEKEFFEEAVRPNLSVFYQRIRNRQAFLEVTKWREHDGEELAIKMPDDEMLDNARYGIMAGALLGGLYLVKKFLKK